MARSRNRRTGMSPALAAPYGQNNSRHSEEYRKAIASRNARKLAKQRAELEIANMHFTTEGDFSHLAAQPMRIRHA